MDSFSSEVICELTSNRRTRAMCVVHVKGHDFQSCRRTERMASLFVDVLRSQMRARRFVVHDFVVMPDHVHILLTVYDDMTLEKAMQLVKGGFSYRAGKELDFQGDVWQRGFSDVLVIGEESFHRHREYIDLNPVKAG